jgi:hypothetical protein
VSEDGSDLPPRDGNRTEIADWSVVDTRKHDEKPMIERDESHSIRQFNDAASIAERLFSSRGATLNFSLGQIVQDTTNPSGDVA